MNITCMEISSLTELPKGICREYAGVPISDAAAAFQKLGETPGVVYQYGKRLFIFEVVEWQSYEAVGPKLRLVTS
jgi:hypothetical protein